MDGERLRNHRINFVISHLIRAHAH